MLPTWLGNNGLPADMSLADAAKNSAVRAEVQQAIDSANKNVSRAESIRKFTILSTEWSEASGHLTPKMSIKRNVIMDDFAGEIDELYSVPGHDDERLARLSSERVRRTAPGLSRGRGAVLVPRLRTSRDSRISRIAIRRVSGASRSR